MKTRIPRVYATLLLCVILLHSSSSFANTQRNDTVRTPFKDRIAVHTNSVDWLLMTPNIGLEYSFIQNDFNKVSFLLHGRYNPNSSTKFKPGYVYNIIGVRPEVRWYFRTREYFDTERELNSLESFWRRLFTRPYSFFAKENPRRYRAYYIGSYISIDKYTIKLGSTGYQGHAYTFGATAGYSIPLYRYKNGSAIDFELGVSVGLAFTSNDKFRYDTEGACFAYEGSRGMGIVPFPVVSDARVAFVYRFNSIRNQIQEVDQRKLKQDSIIYVLRKKYNESNKVYMFSNIPEDSLKEWNSAIKTRNREIREINRRALNELGVDSAMLLQEYALYYPYIIIPEKYFSNFNMMLPNKEITSVAELKSRYLDELIETYSGIKETSWKNYAGADLTVQTLDARLVDKYMTGERATMMNNGDTISGIRLIEYLVSAIPDVNGQVIKLHNDIYHSTGIEEGKSDSTAVADIDKISFQVKAVVPQMEFTGTISTRTIAFVEGLDSVYLKKSDKQKPYTRNSIIEADNIVKRATLEKMFAEHAKKETETKEVNNTGKKRKKKGWMFWKKENSDVILPDTLLYDPEKKMKTDIVLPDTLSLDSALLHQNVLKSDTLAIDTFDADSLKMPLFLYR